MNSRNAEILLVAVMISRSTSFMFSKVMMNGLDTFNILSLRFGISFILLCVIFHKKLTNLKPKTIFKGALVGLGFFGVMTLELTSLKYTSTSTTSFLENTAIVLVPIFEGVLRRRMPDKNIMIACVIAMLGISILTLKNSIGFNIGEALSIVSAIIYASTIIITDRVSKSDDTLVIGVFQVGFLGLYSTISMLAFESPSLPTSTAQYGSLAFLAVVCTGFGYTLQPVVQRYISSEKTGLFCALNPAFASIFGFVFLKETFTPNSIIGDILILSSIIVASVLSNKKKEESKLVESS